MKTALEQALDPIDQSAASIEQAFLLAGESLGRGLDVFDKISRDLSGFLAELQGGDMANASKALDDISKRLVEISRSLPHDAATLQKLVVGNENIAKHLEALLESVRMMTIIARSARIEAVVFGEAAGLNSFTDEMGALTRTVQKEVGRCAIDHAGLTGRIREVAGAQAALDRDFRDKLLVLARELSETFELIRDRQRSGLDLMETMAGRSARISQDTGTALMAMQSGDATRQRLEHVSTALRFAVTLTESDACGQMRVPDQDRPATVGVLCRLQAAQLQDLVAAFQHDVSSIDALLVRLAGDTGELVENGQSIYGVKGRSSESFLTVFRARLSNAAEVVRTCERSRHDVEKATIDLRTRLAALNQTISDLGATTMDLIMVGMNAGLKAARLGLEGRSLMVIADELKRLAGVITTESRLLITIFSDVRQTSISLDRDGDTASSIDVNSAIASVGLALQNSDSSVSAFLATLDEKARQFDAELTGARARFHEAAGANSDLLTTAEALNELVDANFEDVDAAKPYVDALLQPHYTMARERDIHAELVGSMPEPQPAASSAELDCDAFLFAEAG